MESGGGIRIVWNEGDWRFEHRCISLNTYSMVVESHEEHPVDVPLTEQASEAELRNTEEQKINLIIHLHLH